MAVNACPSCTFGVNHTNAIWAKAAAGITKKRAGNITAGSLNIKDSYPIWISQLTRLGRILRTPNGSTAEHQRLGLRSVLGKELLSAIEGPGLISSLPEDLKIADRNSPEECRRHSEVTANGQSVTVEDNLQAAS